LGVSRSTVSRLLKEARESGLVRITFDDRVDSKLNAMIHEHFGVAAHVVPMRRRSSVQVRLEATAKVAARLLEDWFDDDMVLGIAWGTTVSAVALQLSHRPLRNSIVVQLNGAASPHSSGVSYAGVIMNAFGNAFDSSVLYFPVPAFFDFPETKNAMWNERSVNRVLEAQQRADIALFGVGAPEGEIQSQVYAGGYLDQADLRVLRSEAVVGDVCTVLLRADGSFADIELNKRATGPTPAALQQIPRRICVVVGEHKVPALLAALRSGAVTDLVIDEQTAAALVANTDFQLFGGSSPLSPVPGSAWYRAHSGEPGAVCSAALKKRCSELVWLGTMSMSTLMPRSCASCTSATTSSTVPKRGSISR